ncbi:MAG: hypothetical protein C0412_09080 [Flavobacterium sp.]|nr:hypothetical protein [Flavobacterium sp.]
MKEIELQISRFIDGELPFEEQGEFFKALSLNEDARNMLNEYSELKRGIKGHYTGLDIDLSSLKVPLNKEPENKYKKYFYFSAAASIIILIASSFLFTRFFAFQSEIEQVKEGYIRVNNELEGYKKERDTFKTVLAQEARITSPQMVPAVKNKTFKPIPGEKTAINSQRKYTSRIDLNLDAFTTVKITKDDFLVQPIIGN